MPVLFDRSGLADAAFLVDYVYGNKKRILKDLQPLNRLILALLLHDRIFYLGNAMSHEFDFGTFIPLEAITVDYDYIETVANYVQKTIDSGRYGETSRIVGDHYYRRDSRYSVPTNPRNPRHKGVSIGAIEYTVIAQEINCVYYPAQDRLVYLQNFFPTSHLNYDTRSNVMDYVDKESKEFYHEFSARLGTPSLSFRMPLLLDYVYSESENGDVLRTALQMRNSPELINFRRWMNDVDNYVQKGDWVEYDNCFKAIDNIVERIKSMGAPVNKDTEFSITWPPAISIPFTLRHDLNKQRKLGCAFIQNVANFSLRRRPFDFFSSHHLGGI